MTHHSYHSEIFLFPFGRGGCKGGQWIWKDREMSGIGVHDVKFTRNLQKVKKNTLRARHVISPQEVQVGESAVQGHPQSHSVFCRDGGWCESK